MRILRIEIEALAAGELRKCVLFTTLCPNMADALVTVATIDARGEFDIEGQTPACKGCYSIALSGVACDSHDGDPFDHELVHRVLETMTMEAAR